MKSKEKLDKILKKFGKTNYPYLTEKEADKFFKYLHDNKQEFSEIIEDWNNEIDNLKEKEEIKEAIYFSFKLRGIVDLFKQIYYPNTKLPELKYTFEELQEKKKLLRTV